MRLESIGFEWQLVECNDWMEMYDRLVAYKKKHKTTLVSRTYNKDPKLGLWVSIQRRHCKEKDQVDILNNIDFVWECRNFHNDWMEMYNRLVAYKKENKTTLVPQKYKEDLKLGVWVKYQRRHCKENYRVDILNDIGFAWSGVKR